MNTRLRNNIEKVHKQELNLKNYVYNNNYHLLSDIRTELTNK